MVDKAAMIQAEREKMTAEERIVRAVEAIEKQMYAVKSELGEIKLGIQAMNRGRQPF